MDKVGGRQNPNKG